MDNETIISRCIFCSTISITFSKNKLYHEAFDNIKCPSCGEDYDGWFVKIEPDLYIFTNDKPEIK